MKNLFSVLVLSLAIASSTFASQSVPFSEDAFDSAVKNRSNFVVAFHSDSCGSCKIQKPNLEAVLLEDPLKNVSGLMADFESTSDFRKRLNVPVRSPSTILVFKGGQEVYRILGETKKEKIRDLISQNVATK